VLYSPAQITPFCAENGLKLHKFNISLPLFRLKLAFYAVEKYPEKGCSRRPLLPFSSLPASLMVVSGRVSSSKWAGLLIEKHWFCSAKALALFNKSYGFCSAKAMVWFNKSYGLVQQKLWFCSTRPPFSVKKDKNKPVLGGKQPIAEQ
jgi:hypothetical protein